MNDISADLRMSRGRLYILVDGFESDLRAAIDRYLLDHLAEDEVFTADLLAKARDRRSAEGEAGGAAIVHYLDLQAAVDVLLRHKEKLPHEMTLEMTASAATFPTLMPIRHRVMHGRPLLDTDPAVAVEVLSSLRSRHWPETKVTIKRLKEDAAWEPYFEKQPVPNERTLHNLPEVDYDETTFIGRKPEREKLLDALKRRRNAVITLTGEGGIGKTALALDLAYQLLDSADNPYEAILWVSLKTEKLTAHGVEELKDAIRGIDNTVLALGRGLSTDFSGSLRDLADALDGIETLIVIDNLESAHGNEIVEMYDLLPSSVNYLFTSRWGIGQLERTFPVPPLTDSESVLLLRKFSSARRQATLAGLTSATASKTVHELRHSPLAIRWFVLASEAGRVPLETLRDQSVLLEFCVRNVVDNLNADSRAVLSILRSFDRAIGFDEFAILTEMSIDSLRRATQELTRGSLVQVEAEAAGAIAGRLVLTATARMYLPPPDVASEFMATVRRRERQYKASLEESLEHSLSGQRFDRVRPRDANDHPAVYLLESALNFAKSRNYSQARGQIERARSFNPEFYEVYRASARLRCQEGQAEAAVAELQSALNYASDDESRARIHFDIADITSRQLKDAAGALAFSRSAHDLVECVDTSFLHGKLLIWTSKYKEGQEYLQDAHDQATGRRQIVIGTVIVDGWARWAESEYKEHEYESALHKASSGFHIGRQLLDRHPDDPKILDALTECSIFALRSYPHLGDSAAQRQSAVLRSIAQFIKRNAKKISISKVRYLRDAMAAQRSNRSPSGETTSLLDDASIALTASVVRPRA